jgi:hypothetical protein
VGILVDYESPLARRVAGDVWSGLSRAALEAGQVRITAHWESLREGRNAPEEPLVHVFYGVVVAVPDRPSPLAGSLLYQGVQRLIDAGVRAGAVEPALLHAVPEECERYARRLLERLRGVHRTA